MCHDRLTSQTDFAHAYYMLYCSYEKHLAQHNVKDPGVFLDVSPLRQEHADAVANVDCRQLRVWLSQTQGLAVA